jgi:hypothetical protein
MDSDLTEIFSTLHQSQQWRCDRCNFDTKYRSSLKLHALVHPSEVSKEAVELKCGQCEYVTSSKDNLEMHRKNVHKKRFSLKCNLCSFATKYESSLKQHMKIRHPIVQELSFSNDTGLIKDSGMKIMRAISLVEDMKRPRATQVQDVLEQKKHKEKDIDSTLRQDRKIKNTIEHDTSSSSDSSLINCQKCVLVFKYPWILYSHINEKHDANACTRCPEVLSCSATLKRHMADVHRYIRNKICPHCNKEFSLAHKLEQHIKTVHDKVHKCGQCKYVTSSKDNLEMHCKNAHEKRLSLKCSQCNFATKYESSMKGHMTIRHKIEQVSSFSKDLGLIKDSGIKITRAISVAEGMKSHESTHDKYVRKKHELKEKENLEMPEKYKCPLCEHNWTSMEILTLHMKAVHPKPILELRRCDHLVQQRRSELTCSICGYKTLFGSTLKVHTEFAHRKTIKMESGKNVGTIDNDKKVQMKVVYELPPRNQKCPHCAYASCISLHLKEHINAVHGSTKKNNYPQGLKIRIKAVNRNNIRDKQCPQCPWTFACASVLRKHITAIHDKTCSKCSSNFANIWLLNRHTREVHDKIRDMKCPQCPLTFSDMLRLRRHVEAVHELIRNTGLECLKTYSSGQNLNNHVRAFKCSQCSQTFSTSGKHRKHVIVIHDKMKHYCPHCHMVFVSSRSRNMHINLICTREPSTRP